MASWDTPVVSAPKTADYAAPLVDFSKVSNLVDDAYKGKQMFREEQKANLFRNGIPKDASGKIDIPNVTDQAARVGGLDYAMPLLNLQMQGDIGKAAGDVIQPGSTPPQQQQTASPDPMAPKPPPRAVTPLAGAPAVAPASTSQQGDSPGSLIGVLSDAGVPNDQLGALAGRFGAAFKIDPNAPLSADMKAKVLARLEPIKAQIGAVVQPQASSAPVQQPQPQAQPQTQSQAPVTPQVSQADRLDAEATFIRSRAAQFSAVNPKAAEVLNKEADTRADKAKQLREQGADAPSIKEWRQSGSKLPYDDWVSQTEGAKETAKVDAKANSTKYEQFVENGKRAQMEIPQLELLQEQMNDPNFFSGAGEKYNLLYKRLKSAVNIDPDAAVPQELLRKVTASNVLGSLGQLKGLGPIRVAEMNMAREAAAAPDNSVPANKMLVEISKRTHQRNAEVAEMAQAYKEENGALDAGFDKKVTQYYKGHPLFNDAEIKDWHKIISEQKPTQAKAAEPAQMPTFATPDAVHAANLPSGTHFKDANGVTRKVP